MLDESHQTVPQISGMYGGDRSRKLVLVDYGFRLPSALDNRPLNFHEFESLTGQTIYVSATPGETMVTRTFLATSSLRKASEKARTPNLVAE